MAENNNTINYKIFVDTDSGTASVRELNGAIVAGAVPLDKLRSKFGNFAKTVNAADFNKFNKGLKASTAQLENANKQTGAATSATLEFGRVLSDAPYGIRGVANNIQQLASNLFFMGKQVDKTTGKTIGFKGAIGSLVKNLAGPAGVLVAFQGVIALLDYFSTSTKKAETETRSFKEEVEELNTILGKQADHTILASKTIESYLDLLKMKRELDKELSILDERREDTLDYIKNLKASVKTFKDKLAQDKDNIFLQNKVIELEKLEQIERTKLNNIYIDGQAIIDKYKKAKADLTKAEEGTLLALEQQKSALQKEQKEVSKTSQKYKEYAEKIEAVQKKIEEIEGNKNKGKKISPFATPKELEIDIKNAENAIIQYEKKIEDARLKKELNDKLSEAKTEEEKAKIRRNYERDRLINQINAERDSLKLKKSTEEEVVKTKVANHKAELERKHREFVYSVKLKEKLGEITSQQSSDLISQSDQLTNKAMSQADKEAEISVEQIREKYKPLFALFESLAGSRLDALFSMPTKDGGKKDDKKFDFEDGLRKYMELQSSMTSFLSSEYDRQLTIEQNKTNALNNELNQRLLNEDLSKDERERIQLQIGQNDEKLRKKQEAIEKKRFKLNKAANIANATINTYLGASQVIGDKTIPSLAKPFVVAATIASGLLQVAAIARQKFQTSAGSGGSIGAAAGGNGGGDNTREFNFNLAGSTQSNQLTQSIAGQLSQPIQTYVVSSEITSQQQLDLNIANTATIGG